MELERLHSTRTLFIYLFISVLEINRILEIFESNLLSSLENSHTNTLHKYLDKKQKKCGKIRKARFGQIGRQLAAKRERIRQRLSPSVRSI